MVLPFLCQLPITHPLVDLFLVPILVLRVYVVQPKTKTIRRYTRVAISLNNKCMPEQELNVCQFPPKPESSALLYIHSPLQIQLLPSHICILSNYICTSIFQATCCCTEKERHCQCSTYIQEMLFELPILYMAKIEFLKVRTSTFVERFSFYIFLSCNLFFACLENVVLEFQLSPFYFNSHTAVFFPHLVFGHTHNKPRTDLRV